MEDQREQHEQKFREMTQAPVGRLVGRLAFPCIISMLVTAFCNMADTFFVGMMDSNAATGFFSAGALICLAGYSFLTPLASLLGSTETILPYVREYLRVILLGAPWMTASLVLNNQLAQPVSDLCTILCAIPIQCRVLGEIARDPEAN